jgi:hypothetical protein
VPRKVAELCVSALEHPGQLEAMAPASLRSDLRVARLIAAAGAKGALESVEIKSDTDPAYVQIARVQLKLLLGRLAGAHRGSPA